MTRHNPESNPVEESKRSSLDSRIKREVIITTPEDDDTEEDIDPDDDAVDDDPAQDSRDELKTEKRSSISSILLSIASSIATGSFLEIRRIMPLILIFAACCFFNIAMTFLSLNTDREYRKTEARLATLRERSIIYDEQRYNISSKQELTRILHEKYNIEMVDMANTSRRVER